MGVLIRRTGTRRVTCRNICRTTYPSHAALPQFQQTVANFTATGAHLLLCCTSHPPLFQAPPHSEPRRANAAAAAQGMGVELPKASNKNPLQMTEPREPSGVEKWKQKQRALGMAVSAGLAICNGGSYVRCFPLAPSTQFAFPDHSSSRAPPTAGQYLQLIYAPSFTATPSFWRCYTHHR